MEPEGIQPAESGHLSISQAIADLNANDAADAMARKKKDPAAVVVAEDDAADGGDEQIMDPGAADATDEQDAADTTVDDLEAEQPGKVENADDNQQAEAQPIEPPRWWSNEKKALFAQLSPELQAVVFEQEDVRERVVSKAKQESADARKAAETERQKITHQLSVIEPLVKQAQEVFADRWSNVDWVKVAQEVTTQQYNQLRAQYENDQNTMQRLSAAQGVAVAQQFESHTKEQTERLKTVAPDLVDEKLGPQRRAELGKFLTSLNVPAERIKWISADEAAVAYDAMRWRMAEAKAKQAKSKPTPAQLQQQQRPQARSSSAPAASPANARLKAAQAAFDKNPSTRNLQALMDVGG